MDHLDQKIDQLLLRFEAIETELAAPLENDIFIRLSKEYAELMPIAEIALNLRKTESECVDLRALFKETSDHEMRRLVEEELSVSEDRLKDFRQELYLRLLPKEEGDEKNAILELRAGTGGEEAALFVGDLARMYHRYAEFKGWGI